MTGIRPGPGHSRLAVAVAIAIAVIGCSPPPQSSPSTSATPSAGQPAAVSPWQAEIGNLEPDGTRSTASALRLMAMAFGPIPGVDAPTAAPGTVDSASPAVRAIRGSLDRLTPEQRAAVDGYLEVPADSTTLELAATGTGQLPAQRAAFGAADMVATISFGGIFAGYPYTDFERDVIDDAQRIRAHAATYFGEMPGLRIRLANHPDEPYVSFFNPTAGPGGIESCDVVINVATANVDRFRTRRALSLDVIHCFQSNASGSEAGRLGQVPAWAWDGPAEYITLEQWPPTESDTQAWLVYLTTPDDSLFERSYDAVGYFAQAFHAGADFALAFKAVLTDVDNPARFALAGTASDRFLDSWASGLAQANWGGGWGFSGPGIPIGVQAPSDPIAVANGAKTSLSQAAYSNHLYVIDARADLVRLEFDGRARIGDGKVDSVIRGTAVFCTTDKGCGPCPDGDPPPFQATRLAPTSLLALGGGTDGTSGIVSGHALEEFCDRPSPTPSEAFCRRWRSYLDWAREEEAAGHELDRALAAAIVMQFVGMRPVAPPELVPKVDVVITVFRIYATDPEELPIGVPLAGRGAEAMYEALLAMDAYCKTNAFPTS